MAKDLQLLGFVNLKDIANACIYLLSDASRWVTGSYLVVDGGILRDRFEGIQQSHIIAFLLKVCRNLWRFFCVWDERIKMIKGVWARDLFK